MALVAADLHEQAATLGRRGPRPGGHRSRHRDGAAAEREQQDETEFQGHRQILSGVE
jgi:hypothetical protein